MAANYVYFKILLFCLSWVGNLLCSSLYVAFPTSCKQFRCNLAEHLNSDVLLCALLFIKMMGQGHSTMADCRNMILEHLNSRGDCPLRALRLNEIPNSFPWNTSCSISHIAWWSELSAVHSLSELGLLFKSREEFPSLNGETSPRVFSCWVMAVWIVSLAPGFCPSLPQAAGCATVPLAYGDWPTCLTSDVAGCQ